jgi:hypothetical protein
MSWTIKGEAGKTLDATARALAAGLNISSCVLKFQSLAADTLTWTADTTAATGAGTIIPDFGQIVELYWDATRKFRGHVTGVRVGTRKITVTVDGPAWWMERTNLTSSILPYVGADGVTAGQTAAERAQYVFPTQSLATSISALLARAVTNGVPMTAGSVATMYDVPRITLSEMSCANALATLMSWCPDAVAWFDYSGAAPVLNVTRRGVAAAITYTIATDAVEIGEIVPRMDLQVARSELHYVTRNATSGKPAWASQASGTDAAGKRQIVTISGPEIVDFLPKDDFESVTVQTANAAISSALVAQRDTGLAAIIARYGYLPGAIADWISYYVTSYNPADYNGRRLTTRYFSPYTITTDAGVKLSTAVGKYIVLTGDLPDWAMTLLGGIRVQITGTWVATNTSGTYSDVERMIQDGGFGFSAGWLYQSGPETYYVSGRQFSISGILVNAPKLTPTAIYKAWDYDYLTPPAGLAAALVAAQSWVPWEGPITLAAEDCSGDNLLPHQYHLANALPACSTMGALAKGVSHDLMMGRTTIDLGAPARMDFGTLVSRVRQDPKDNIVYL